MWDLYPCPAVVFDSVAASLHRLPVGYPRSRSALRSMYLLPCRSAYARTKSLVGSPVGPL
jgi:hypothetical protein